MLPNALIFSDDPAVRPVSTTIDRHGWGWILFTIALGKQRFQTRFSEVFDPIPHLKRWLEAIAIGVEQCSFSYDPEGIVVRMSYCRTGPNKGFFCVGNDGWNDDIRLSGDVDPKQLVACFYRGFQALFHSPGFQKEKWEVYYVWEPLAEAFHTNYDRLLAGMLSLSRQELAMIRSFDLLSPTIPVPGMINRGVEWKLFIQQLQAWYFATKEEQDREGWVTSGDLLPEDYDQWSDSEKKALLEKELHSSYADHGDGEKVVAFRSEIVEAFIGKK